MRLKSLFIALLATVTLSASAQQGSTNTQRSNPSTPQGQDDITTFSRNQSDRMADDLELNDNQRNKLYDQNSAYYRHQQSVHDNDLSDADRQKATDKHNKEHDKNMREILDDDQYKRYNKSRDQYTPEYRQDQRNSPTQQGTESRQRHGGKK